jgi:CheY-like chemotaxis protein
MTHDLAMLFFRKKAPAPPVPVTIPPPKPEPTEPSDDGRPRKKIMVIDDDPVVLKTLEFTLKSNGYKVVTATDGSQAIGLMRDEEPDMMLVDVSFPNEMGAAWDGFQIAQWIRQMNGKLPTIVISGADKPEYKKRAAVMGAQAFMTKPINNELLLASIASALGSQSNVQSPMSKVAPGGVIRESVNQ